MQMHSEDNQNIQHHDKCSYYKIQKTLPFNPFLSQISKLLIADCEQITRQHNGTYGFNSSLSNNLILNILYLCRWIVLIIFTIQATHRPLRRTFLYNDKKRLRCLIYQ